MRLNTGRPGNVPEAKWDDGFPVKLTAGGTAVRLRVLKETVDHVSPPSGPWVVRQTKVAVICYAAGGAGATPAQAVDPLLAWATKALAGQKLASKSFEVDEEKGEWEWAREDLPYVAVPMFFTVPHVTSRGDQETQT